MTYYGLICNLPDLKSSRLATPGFQGKKTALDHATNVCHCMGLPSSCNPIRQRENSNWLLISLFSNTHSIGSRNLQLQKPQFLQSNLGVSCQFSQPIQSNTALVAEMGGFLIFLGYLHPSP